MNAPESRIGQIFAGAGRSLPPAERADRATILMPFITGGFPSLELTAPLLQRIERGGASICEIGFPFSDPVADGPVIASSMHDAISRGFHVDRLLEAVREARPTVELGLIAMVSYSIIYRVGLRPFVDRCQAAGFDGFIFPDLPVDEAGEAQREIAGRGMSFTLLIAPTTSADRAAAIAQACRGFAYLIARVGLTGERSDAPAIASAVATIRRAADIPIACGFGVSTPEAVRAVTEHADAAIVGSAMVRRLRELERDSEKNLLDGVEALVRHLAGGLAIRSTPG